MVFDRLVIFYSSLGESIIQNKWKKYNIDRWYSILISYNLSIIILYTSILYVYRYGTNST